VQRMSAGTGVVHSEFNGSESEPVHFFQVWILPEKNGIAPGYEQKLFPEEERRGRLRLLVAPGGVDGSLDIHQDARLYSAILDAGAQVTHSLAEGRGAWIQIARGSVEVNGVVLARGDGASIEDVGAITITAREDGSEFLLFDLR
jgi:quercetin 2,3-dioxygenase